MFPALEALIPHLTDRGRVEVDLALARWQLADLTARHEEMSAALIELEAEKIASAGEKAAQPPNKPKRRVS